jgi:hypothetical protein
MDAELGGKDRRLAARHPAQWQPLQRAHVRAQDVYGPATDREWAEERARWEVLFEAIQTKGQSESHPSLSPTDEFAASYELWDRGNLNLVPKKPGMIQYEYAREALKNGLKLEQDLGANPFKFGLASGSDAHTGLTAMEEDNYFGKFVSCEPRPERWSEDAMKFGDRV